MICVDCGCVDVCECVCGCDVECDDCWLFVVGCDVELCVVGLYGDWYCDVGGGIVGEWCECVVVCEGECGEVVVDGI